MKFAAKMERFYGEDNVLTLLIAGHDTTTAALTWLIKFLEENPTVLEQLREEHRQIIANRKSGTNLTWSEINNMLYTAKVISETLRRATILPWFSRKASQDFEIDGCKIKKGWSINLDVVSIHHNPEVFPDPEKFDPSRFDEPLRPFCFLGFGSGPRMCPGMNLAKLEICVFIHHLSRDTSSNEGPHKYSRLNLEEKRTQVAFGMGINKSDG
ncbi:Cytochrome P450 [Sesbania bispinosa]|nr:Cytochrome P450 [Sesbania bispinosa]